MNERTNERANVDRQLMVTEDPAPLPMRDEEDADLRAAYPADPEPAEDENWTK
jgi:hypothetical protein